MKKLLLTLLVLSTTSVLLVSCGGGGTEAGPAPIVPVTGNVVFLQKVPDASFAPVLGTFSGNQLTASRVKDPSTEDEVYGNFHSIILSPDKKKAAFDLYGGMGNNSTNQWDIYVGRLDPNTVTQITNDAYMDGWPQFNPSGTAVIYSSLRPSTLYENYDQWMLVTRSADGTGVETLLSFGGTLLHAWSPTYSPDGSKIALEGWGYDQQDNWVDGIYIMSADGSNPVMLTNPSTECDCWDDTPSFTSDGTKIVFSRDIYDASTATEAEDIYIMNADGTGTPTKLTDGVGSNSDPLVLKDPGNNNTDKILFASNRDNLNVGNDGFEIYCINLDGTGLMRLTNNAFFDAFSTEYFEGIDSTASVRATRSRRAGQTATWAHIPGKTLHW